MCHRWPNDRYTVYLKSAWRSINFEHQMIKWLQSHIFSTSLSLASGMHDLHVNFGAHAGASHFDTKLQCALFKIWEWIISERIGNFYRNFNALIARNKRSGMDFLDNEISIEWMIENFQADCSGRNLRICISYMLADVNAIRKIVNKYL